MHKSALLQTLSERGFIANATDMEGLDSLLSSKKAVPVYIGFDCTAPSLHVGSLIQIMILRHIQRSGHKPIVLMGGGTTKVGDPSGKDESRKMLDDAAIAANMKGIQSVFAKYMEFEESFDASSTKAFMVNNDDWLKDINYIEFLRDYGPHFSINRMMSFDSVKLRLEREQHLSFLEFNYMLLQAYDFVELNKRIGCRLQIGGSDQWGNIVNGTELQRRLGRKEDLFGLTTPLLTTSSGAKMGKTANGAIWLNADMLSPYDYWQFWRNTEDADVTKFLKLFTELQLEEIAEYEKLAGSAAINDAKIRLANEATTLLHGKAAADEAHITASAVFAGTGVAATMPTVTIDRSIIEKGIPAYKLFVEAGLEESGGKARKLIEGGGAKLNDEKITSPEQLISLTDFKNDDGIKLSAGKKRHILVKAA